MGRRSTIVNYATNNRICITKCPYFPEEHVYIGSARCIACTRNKGRDTVNKTVKCSCPEDNNNRYAMKREKEIIKIFGIDEVYKLR